MLCAICYPSRLARSSKTGRESCPPAPPTSKIETMRTDEARPVHLKDYRPPDWLVEKVDLDVALHPTETRVRATLKLSPNPEAAAPAPIVLDGDGLTLTS